MDMKNLINRPHFTAGGGGGELPPDAAIPTRIRVCLDNVVPYAGNPRQSRNPKYDEIKESIRAMGLNFPPNVTRENPSDPYMIRDGGNTRLQILNELWQETGDRRYYEFDCLFHPFTFDLDIMIRHVVENEMRGGMILIDRGIAALKAKKYFEQGENKTLSNIALARSLKEMGWTIDDKSLGVALYAAEVLLEIIPGALWAGLGIDSVKRVRKIIEDCRKFWMRLPEHVEDQEDAEAEFEIIWTESLTSQDHEDFSVDAAQNAMEASIAGYIDCPVSSVRGEIQAMSRGVSQGGVKPVSALDQPGVNPAPINQPLRASNPTSTVNEQAVRTEPTKPEAATKPRAEAVVEAAKEINDFYREPEQVGTQLDDNWNDGHAQTEPSIVSFESPVNSEQSLAGESLYSLQQRCFGLVSELFILLNLSHCAVDTSQLGFQRHYGFLIVEPSDHDKSFMDQAIFIDALYQQFALLGASVNNLSIAAPEVNIDWLENWGGARGILKRSIEFQGGRNYALTEAARADADAGAVNEFLVLGYFNKAEQLVAEMFTRFSMGNVQGQGV